jgi:hypothetical protein
MRGCTIVSQDFDAIFLFDWAIADLGTVASPGNNNFRSTSGVGINIAGFNSPRQIYAVGNTWRPTVQSADPTGRYPDNLVVSDPTDVKSGNNYANMPGWSLRL